LWIVGGCWALWFIAGCFEGKAVLMKLSFIQTAIFQSARTSLCVGGGSFGALWEAATFLNPKRAITFC
jgi:hypothetical protein